MPRRTHKVVASEQVSTVPQDIPRSKRGKTVTEPDVVEITSSSTTLSPSSTISPSSSTTLSSSSSRSRRSRGRRSAKTSAPESTPQVADLVTPEVTAATLTADLPKSQSSGRKSSAVSPLEVISTEARAGMTMTVDLSEECEEQTNETAINEKTIQSSASSTFKKARKNEKSSSQKVQNQGGQVKSTTSKNDESATTKNNKSGATKSDREEMNDEVETVLIEDSNDIINDNTDDDNNDIEKIVDTFAQMTDATVTETDVILSSTENKLIREKKLTVLATVSDHDTKHFKKVIQDYCFKQRHKVMRGFKNKIKDQQKALEKGKIISKPIDEDRVHHDIRILVHLSDLVLAECAWQHYVYKTNLPISAELYASQSSSDAHLPHLDSESRYATAFETVTEEISRRANELGQLIVTSPLLKEAYEKMQTDVSKRLQLNHKIQKDREREKAEKAKEKAEKVESIALASVEDEGISKNATTVANEEKKLDIVKDSSESYTKAEEKELMKLYATLTEGYVACGVVQGIRPYGLFIHIIVRGYVMKALCHISDCWPKPPAGKVTENDLAQKFAVGDRICGVVTKVDPVDKKVSLSFASDKYPVGEKFRIAKAEKLLAKSKREKEIEEQTNSTFVSSLATYGARQPDTPYIFSMKALKKLSAEKGANANRTGQRARRKYFYEFFGLDAWVEEQKVALSKRIGAPIDGVKPSVPYPDAKPKKRSVPTEQDSLTTSSNVDGDVPKTDAESSGVDIAQKSVKKVKTEHVKVDEMTQKEKVQKPAEKDGKKGGKKNRVYKDKDAEELHPSWAARKNQKVASFAGTRVVFN